MCSKNKLIVLSNTLVFYVEKNKTNICFFKCFSLLNHVGNKKVQLQIVITITLAFISPSFWYLSIWLPSYWLVFFIFTSQDSLDHILQDRSSSHKLLQTLFIWECLTFLPFFWRTVLLDIAFLVDSFFLLALWLFIYPVPSGLQYFWREICW